MVNLPESGDPTSQAFQSIQRKTRQVILIAAAFSLGINLLMLTLPLYMLQIFERVLVSGSLETLALLTVIVSVAVLTLGMLEAVRSFLFIRLGTAIERKLGGHVLACDINAALQGSDESEQRLKDLTVLRGFLSSRAVVPLLDVPWTPIFIFVIFLLHPVLGILAVCGTVLLLTIVCANEFISQQPRARGSAASSESMQDASDALRQADVVMAMAYLPALVGRWHDRRGQTLDMQTRAANRSAIAASISRFVRLSLQVGVFGLGALLVIQEQITVGAMIATSILMARALAPIDMLLGTWRSAMDARGALLRLRRALSHSQTVKPQVVLPRPTGRLSVENFAFAYPGQREPILRSVDFRLEAGESLGLIGPIGCGKTTLARILIGSLTPQLGHVRLDGIDVSRWPPEQRGQFIGYVPQSISLFRAKVGENIGRLSDTDDGVVQAAQLAGAHKMIATLANGYETEVRGDETLSVGQRQLIALARAVYGEPRLLVLDQPLANLDQEAEVALLSTISALRQQGTTIVVVSSRPFLLNHLDKILLLGHGRVMAFGPRSEILPQLIKSPAASQPVNVTK